LNDTDLIGIHVKTFKKEGKRDRKNKNQQKRRMMKFIDKKKEEKKTIKIAL
jgi:hypothetical protein